MIKLECYIEEYESEAGISARLVDKKTGKKVSIQMKSFEDRTHFLQFISAAKNNVSVMPTVFDRNGEDIIAVYGVKQKENRNTIFMNIDVSGGGYVFE